MKRIFFAVIIVFLIIVITRAEDVMRIYKKGGSVDEYLVSLVDSMKITTVDAQQKISVVLKDSTMKDYPVNQIDSVVLAQSGPTETDSFYYVDANVLSGSLYINTALNDAKTYGVAKINRLQFLSAIKEIELCSHNDSMELIVSGFNVNEGNKYIRFSDIDRKGTKTDIARFYGDIPELKSKMTAIGYKWLPLYNWGKYNPTFKSVKKAEFQCGRVLVNLAALYQQTLIPYNGYMDGTSGMVATYDNTGVKSTKIKRYTKIPAVIAASQQFATGTFNVGAYTLRRNCVDDLGYNWQSTVGIEPYKGFDLINGNDKNLLKPYVEKSLVKAQYGHENVSLLETRNGYVYASKKNVMFKVNADSLSTIIESDIFHVFSKPIGKYNILSIQRMEWFSENTAFLWAIVKFEKNTYRCVVIKFNLDTKEADVVIEMPSCYTMTPTSWYSEWGYSRYGKTVVINDYGTQGFAGRVWISENGGDSFRCIFKMFDNSVIGETDSSFAVNPAIEWEKATTGDCTRNGNHVHGSAYDPYWDRVWVVQGDVMRDDIYDGGPYSSIWYSDDWRNPVPTWSQYKLRDSDLKGILGNKQFVGIYVLPECVLFGSDNGDEMGTFRVNRTDKNKFILDKGEIVADRNSGSGIVYIQGGYFKPNDNHPLYSFYNSHNRVPGYPSFLTATWNGLIFHKIWTESAELTATWGAKTCLLDDDRIVVICAGKGGYNSKVGETISNNQSMMYIIECGTWKQ